VGCNDCVYKEEESGVYYCSYFAKIGSIRREIPNNVYDKGCKFIEFITKHPLYSKTLEVFEGEHVRSFYIRLKGSSSSV